MIWFVVNPMSGNGRGMRIWQQVERVLAERRIEYGCRLTERPGHARQIAVELAGGDQAAAIVAVGGDGTVHEVANGLIGTPVAIGFIPAGSGNDFARSLGIPAKWQEALERVLLLQRTRIDAGAVNGRIFAISSGIGFDGDVAYYTNRSWYKRWLNRFGLGSLSYVVTVLRLLITYKPSDIELDIDGNRSVHRGVWLIAIANMPYYGGGMKICPEARHNDGILHMCLVANIGRLELLRFFPRVYRGTHTTHPSVTMLAGSRIRIEASVPMTIHTDGEFGGSTPAHIVALPQQLYVL
ncbi:diacylglycerol/lipid kinase family protein [Paenibacillus ginsengarvi]|uniref:Diacylglycerol kinase family lipid kinase n=1 Tax=Paenibacillus ginsengarvi TaxID=400777 RepID=A0A3B0CPJ4_9BACL|nr:diacylglycerol kinase family protein [Paenibacillus ginsengarvi]RKN86438.1 diacylglycerol kinase family lipid kinase [Paenibacillus ginsengarvi]